MSRLTRWLDEYRALLVALVPASHIFLTAASFFDYLSNFFLGKVIARIGMWWTEVTRSFWEATISLLGDKYALPFREMDSLTLFVMLCPMWISTSSKKLPPNTHARSNDPHGTETLTRKLKMVLNFESLEDSYGRSSARLLSNQNLGDLRSNSMPLLFGQSLEKIRSYWAFIAIGVILVSAGILYQIASLIGFVIGMGLSLLLAFVGTLGSCLIGWAVIAGIKDGEGGVWLPLFAAGIVLWGVTIIGIPSVSINIVAILGTLIISWQLYWKSTITLIYILNWVVFLFAYMWLTMILETVIEYVKQVPIVRDMLDIATAEQ